jgi:hypothetical protein
VVSYRTSAGGDEADGEGWAQRELACFEEDALIEVVSNGV